MSNLKAIHEATRLQPINKLMVVGHPLSGYTSVLQVLHNSGLQAAAASKSQGLSPAQVSKMLLRAYRVQPLTELQALDDFKPIVPSPVWQTLVLDLLLGNLEQELWGWADPQAIYLLDYWKNLDHQLAFVLVYDSPQTALANLFDNSEVECTESVVQAASSNWLAYNEALLNFYLGNTERCLLVHGQQVRAQSIDYLQQVQHQMGVALQMPTEPDVAQAHTSSLVHLQTELCQRVLAAHPKVLQMYADLQSVASLPQVKVNNQPSFDTDLAMLMKFVELQRSNLKIQRYVEELKAAKEAQEHALNQQLAALVQSFEHAQAHGNNLEQERQNLVVLADERQTNIEELRAEKEAQAAQKEALNQQLTSLMQSFEQAQAHGNSLEQERQNLVDLAEARREQIEGLAHGEADLQARVNDLAGQLQQARDELNQYAAVAAADYVTSNKVLEEENDHLLQQLHKVQEKLERTNKQIKINKYRVSQAEEKLNLIGLNGAVDIIKNSKTYKLGNELVICNRSIKSYLTLPIRLHRISQTYKNQMNGLEIKNINFVNYSDGFHAYQIKNHLSYKFGEIIEETSFNLFLLILLPFRLNEAYKKWKHTI